MVFLNRSLKLVLLGLALWSPASAQTGFTTLGSSLYAIDLDAIGTPGFATFIGDVGLQAGPVALDPVGDLFVISHTASPALYRLDPTDATPTMIGVLGVPMIGPRDLAFAADGSLWLTSDSGLFSLDASSGQATQVTGSTSAWAIVALSNRLLATHHAGGPVPAQLVELDRGTGSSTPLFDLPSGSSLGSPLLMDAAPDGDLRLLYVNAPPVTPPAYSYQIFEVDPGTGVATAQGPTFGTVPERYLGLALTAPTGPLATEVPTLGALGLLVLSLTMAVGVLLALRGRRGTSTV